MEIGNNLDSFYFEKLPFNMGEEQNEASEFVLKLLDMLAVTSKLLRTITT